MCDKCDEEDLQGYRQEVLNTVSIEGLINVMTEELKLANSDLDFYTKKIESITQIINKLKA